MMQKHILIVDDEPNMRNSLLFILTAANYRLSSAANAREALEIIERAKRESQPLDLCITDIQMPESNGIELIDEIQRRGHRVPVLVITGYGDKEMVVQLLRRGCKDFLDKPFEPADILHAADAVLRREEEERARQESLRLRLEEEKAELESQIARQLRDIEELRRQVAQFFPASGHPGNGCGTEYRVAAQGEWEVITPSGDMLESSAERLRSLLLHEEEKGVSRLRFNFSHVRLIDSVSFSIFLVFAKMLLKRQRKVDMEIVGAGDELKRLFRFTHLDEVYHIRD